MVAARFAFGVALAVAGCEAACSFPDLQFGADEGGAVRSTFEGGIETGRRSTDEAGALARSGSSDDPATSGDPGASGSSGGPTAGPGGSGTPVGTSGSGSAGSSATGSSGAANSGTATSGSIATSGTAGSGSTASSGTTATSGSASSGTATSGTASSGTATSGTASSGTAGGNCGCDPSQMYPTNIQCGTVANLLGIGIGCSGPAQGFTDNPACGHAGNFATCTGTLTVLGLGTACTASPGPSTVQQCR